MRRRPARTGCWTGVNAIGSGASFAIAGNLQVTGSTLVSGASTVAAGARVTSSGSLSFLGTLGNQGTLEASHGTLSISAVSGTGLLEIGTSSTLALLGRRAARPSHRFPGSGRHAFAVGTLQLCSAHHRVWLR